MKNMLLPLLMMVSVGAWAGGLTVKEADIAGRSDLVRVLDAKVDGQAMTILTDSQGISLYTFELDAKGKSNCSARCLKEWPPQHVPKGASVEAPFGVIQGNDGQQQLTLEGMPLYHYDDDQKPGDTNGQYPKWDVIQIQK